MRAAFLLGESYRARGKSTEALDAYTTFLKEEGFKVETDQARRDWAELAMTASFQVGEILQGQQKFAEAIAAWKGYLAKFPNGPQSADAQRAILDTQLLIAADHRQPRPASRSPRRLERLRQPEPPRRPRAPGPLPDRRELRDREEIRPGHRRLGAAHQSKFPGSEPAAHAQFLTASFYENEKGNPAEAIERFKKIAVEPWAAQARQRVAVMEAKALVVITPRTFRSGEGAHLKITTRNIENAQLHRLQAERRGVFPQEDTRSRTSSRSTSAWSRPMPPGRSRSPAMPSTSRSRATMTLKKLELPGVYVVKVTDEKTLQATTLVIGSDLDAIVKTSRDQILVFAQDMKTGRGRAGARVLVADGGQVVLEGVTGPDGVLLRDWDPPRAGNGRLSYLVLDGPHVAGSGLGVPDKVAQGLTPAPTSTPTGRPIGPDRRSRSAAWSARSRTASMPTCPRRSTASRSPTAADG